MQVGTLTNLGKLQNKLEVDLTKIDMVVVSHAHPDHLNGLDYLLTIHPKVWIYFPEDIFSGTLLVLTPPAPILP